MIVLIGYMGSGKTTVGNRLASKLNKQFIDLDKKIEERVGKNIPQIFDLYGEYFFRKIEYIVLKEELGKREGGILATGGGTPVFFDSMQLINSRAKSIYLKLDTKLLCNRLKSTQNTRPILKDKNDKELFAFIDHQLKLREPLYSKAHHTIVNNSIDATVNELMLIFNLNQ